MGDGTLFNRVVSAFRAISSRFGSAATSRCRRSSPARPACKSIRGALAAFNLRRRPLCNRGRDLHAAHVRQRGQTDHGGGDPPVGRRAQHPRDDGGREAAEYGHVDAALAGAITLGSRLSLSGLADDLSLVSKRFDEPTLNQRNLCVMTMRARRLSRPIEGVLRALIVAIERVL
ncbi:hypothetical protein LMG27952_03885 [Paraburkholderia hiiakae]|uniref:LysR substrate-binding domain-containing protein n=1 Tax=Paraburkholderia hiiakae TaxID=1081782 RepID=A0ABN7HWT6_9BURK|nr:hypothetical protein LMG27952_03885 [Paraburkholderia hiiakae]